MSLLVIVTLCAPSAQAWSHKEHILLTRLTVMRLLEDPNTPPAMKAWLRSAGGPLGELAEQRDYFLNQHIGPLPRGADGLAFWSIYPDLAAMTDKREWKLAYFNINERKLHFLDVEYFSRDPARRKYADDLSSRPELADFPRDIRDNRYQQAGMLPFATEHFYGQMVKAIRDGRLDDKPGQFPRDEHAARYAGILAHYVQDNFQPHHATEDYKSWSYFGKDNPPNVHGDMEYRLVDDNRADYPQLRREYWDALMKALEGAKDPFDTADVWKGTIQVSLMSYSALPMIGRAAQAAYPGGRPEAWDAAAFFHHKGHYLGQEMTVLEMKARQQAMAVARVAGLWRRAWEEGAR